MRVPALVVASALVLVVLGFGASPATATDGAENVTLYRVEDVDLDDADTIASAIENGTATLPDETIAGETLVVVIDSGRLAADLDARDGSTTDRFFEALDGDAELRIDQTNPPPQQTRKVIPIGRENTSVHRDGTTTFVLLDTGTVEYQRYRADQNEPTELRDGDRFAVTFGYDLEEYATAGPEFALFTTEGEFYNRYSFDPLAPEVVNRSVKVNVEPDESLLARVVLDDGETITAPVESVVGSGFQRTSLDLRGVEPGTKYVLELVHDGEVVDSFDGTVRDPTASLTDVEVTEVENWTAVNVTANLSHAGSVRVLNESGEELGYTRIDSNGSAIAPGVETDLTIRIRGEATGMLHVRAARQPGAGEEYYRGPDAEATIDFEDREIRTPDELASETPTPTGTPPQETTASGSTPTPMGTIPPQGGVPLSGFGPVVALVAFVTSIAVAVTRRS